jgi:transposase
MRILPKEFRQRAIKAYKTGRYTQAHLAEVYGVTRKTINNWLKIERTEQRYESLPRGHRRESFTEEEKKRLILLVEERPDLTLEQLRAMVGKDCTIQTVHNTLRRLGIFLKKLSGPLSKHVRMLKKHEMNGRYGNKGST